MTSGSHILQRMKQDPNAAAVAQACEDALDKRTITPEDLRAWEAAPAWIYNAPLNLPMSLREHAYRLLVNDERVLVERHMQPLVKHGLKTERLIEAVQEYKGLHGGMTDEAVAGAYRENPYILGQVLKPEELSVLDAVRPPHLSTMSLTRLRAHVASAWRFYRQMGQMNVRPNSPVTRHGAETLAKLGDHNKEYYLQEILDHFAQLVPDRPTTDWPYPMTLMRGKDGQPSQASPSWIYHSLWQAARALMTHVTRPRHGLPDGWEEWLAGLKLQDADQEAALIHAWEYPLTILSGGPGTGKTRLAQALKQATERFGGSILGCAPTGIAAKRMGLSARIDSETVHHRYGLFADNRHVGQGSLQIPLADHQFVVVDEAGMLDLLTFHAVVWGTPSDPGVRIVLMGDGDQLPPVGYAQPFVTLLKDSEMQPFVVHLTTGHRSTNDLARATQVYFDADLPLPWGDELVARNVPSGETESFRQAVLSWVAGLNPETSWQVLIPYRSESTRHAFGSHEVNTWLTEGVDSLGVGQRIVQRENSRTTDLKNGELGRILTVERTTRTALFEDGTQVTLPHEEAYREWMPANCLTVHKAQGGEYDHTLVILPPGTSNVDPRNLYTAMSRSKLTLTVLARDVQAEVDVIRRGKRRNPPSAFDRVLKSVRQRSQAPNAVKIQQVQPDVAWDL